MTVAGGLSLDHREHVLSKHLVCQPPVPVYVSLGQHLSPQTLVRRCLGRVFIVALAEHFLQILDADGPISIHVKDLKRSVYLWLCQQFVLVEGSREEFGEI